MSSEVMRACRDIGWLRISKRMELPRAFGVAAHVELALLSMESTQKKRGADCEWVPVAHISSG